MESQNSLSTETSPYLLQHADNPVHWHPWGEPALKLAQDQNKPVLLSVGYSACHWCHVMAHESFEDPATAQVMNEHFINIKVDREERPDLDKIYQTAHHLLAQRPGGWPLTMFLMPDDQVPFFGGTYFPDKARHGLPAFKDMLMQISDFYQNKRDQLTEQNQSLMDSMQSLQQAKSNTSYTLKQLDQSIFDIARRELEQNYDKTNGGFGKAPKFPHPTYIDRLLRHWSHTGQQDQGALNIACHTLTAMALGGMNDQIGGGFCRYSVDDQWMIPHFEKMLYDNGPLLSIYTSAWLATGTNLYKTTIEQTADWVLTEMQSPEGGFYSSLDADSEGEEGKFYVWTPEEVKVLLSELQYKVFAKRFGFDRAANFEGKWNPHVYNDIDTITAEENLSIDETNNLLNESRSILYKTRLSRTTPGRDDKVLTSWNALMIKGLAQAGRALNNENYITAAQRAFDFIKNVLWHDNRLLATTKDGKTHLNAYLDDYVFLIDAGLELLQSDWRNEDLLWITELADVVIEQFEDTERGGFYFTSNDHEKLIQRPKPVADESTPAGNGVAAYALNRLGLLIGNTLYTDAAERCVLQAYESIKNYASAHNTMLHALEELLNPVKTIIIIGNQNSLDQWKNTLKEKTNSDYHPRQMIFSIAKDKVDSHTLPESIKTKINASEKPMAFICEGMTCTESMGLNQ